MYKLYEHTKIVNCLIQIFYIALLSKIVLATLKTYFFCIENF